MGLEKYGDSVRKDIRAIDDTFFSHLEDLPKVIVDNYLGKYQNGDLSIGLITKLVNSARTGQSLMDKLSSIHGLTPELVLEADEIYNKLRPDLLYDGIENNALIDDFSQWMKSEARNLERTKRLDKNKTCEAIKIMINGSAKMIIRSRSGKKTVFERVCEYPEIFCYGVLNGIYTSSEIEEIRKHALYPPLAKMKPSIFDRSKNISKVYRDFSKDYQHVMYEYLLYNTSKKLSDSRINS